MAAQRRTGLIRTGAAAVLLLAAGGANPALGQGAGQQDTPASCGQEGGADRGPRGHAVRTVRTFIDPATGDCWLLQRDAGLAGGPGRLARAGRGGSECPQPARRQEVKPNDAGVAGGQGSAARNSTLDGAPLIRAGQRLIVEENTPVVAARLEAVALESGSKGGRVRVRLAVGGRALTAVVLGPGRAGILPGDATAWRQPWR